MMLVRALTIIWLCLCTPVMVLMGLADRYK